MKKEFIITTLCFVFMFFVGAFSSAVKAVTYYVNSDADGPVRNGSCVNSAGCTLREAMQRAQGGDEIQFASPYFDSPRTIRLTQGSPLATFNGDTVTVRGRGADKLTIDGNNSSSVINVDSRGFNGNNVLNLYSMTLINGRNPNPSAGGGGGGIYVLYGTVNLNQVVITNCSAAYGGAIYSDSGNVSIQHSTLYNNSASVYGSAIYSGSRLANKNLLEITATTISGNSSSDSKGAAIYSLRTEMHIHDATITKNSANGGGSAGGIFIDSSCNIGSNCQSYLDVNSSIVAENPNVASPNISGTINAQAYSLLGGNPLLLPLAFNPPGVGVTGLPTHALDTCSPAINAGAVPPNVTSDEQYDPRVLQGRADIGAYESFLLPCPGSITVTNSNDSGSGSLRQAVNDIGLNGTINFASGVSNVVLTGGEISISRDVNISGDGANQITVHGNNQSRIFTVPSGKTLNLSKIVLADGNAGGALGGAIVNNGTLNVTSSAIVNNKAQSGGGGISNGGTLSLINVTVSGNQSNGKGAGIYNNGGSTNIITVVNSTITDNRSFGYTGAGVWNDNFSGSDTFRVRNSIIDGNFSDQGYAHDFVGDITNQGYNLIGTRNPQLAPLADNGGATLTHALLCGSAAIDAADPNNGSNPATDQRGASRPVNGRADIGAFEAGVCTNLVTNGGNGGAGSLRQAILDANTGGTINFASNVNGVTLTGGELLINKNLTISGGTIPFVISGNNQSRVFNIAPGATLNLNRVTITGGNNSGGGAVCNYGTLNMTASTVSGNSDGGIGNYGGTMTILNSTVSGNNNGGIVSSGITSLLNSTVSGNRTNGKGAGIYNNGGGNILITVLNSTITDNRSFGYTGAGVWNDNGSNTFRVRNSIIDGNISDQGYAHDYVGGRTDQGNNLIGTRNPGLAPLGNYGGATQTHALLQTSQAIDAGNNCVITANGCGDNNAALTTDQRGAGAARQIGSNIDIGAYERNLTFNQTTLPNATTGANYDQTLTVTRQTSYAEFYGNQPMPDSPYAPFTFSIIQIAGQQLPPGLSLSSGGTISGTPTMTGTYTFTVKAADADGLASAHQYAMQVFGPTAATVSISGRVIVPQDLGLTNALVTLTDGQGNSRTVITGKAGRFIFREVMAGEMYILSVQSKRYRYTPQVISVVEDVTDLTFAPQ